MTQFKRFQKFYPLLCIFSLVQLQNLLPESHALSADYDLYSPQDDVIRLNSTTFNPTVFQNSENIVHMVQFYNSYCGHCQAFSPIYKDLASRLKNWTSVFRIAGIDCSKDENVITCSDNKIQGYPTIHLYPPKPRQGVAEDEPLNLRSLGIEWTVDDIEEAVIDYLGNLTKSARQHPPVVEALQPVEVKKLRDFKRLYPLESKHDEATNEHHGLQDLMFIIESEKSYLGRKLIVEYYRISNRLELRRILLSNKELLQSMLTEEDLAKLDQNQPVLVRANYLDDESKRAQSLVKGELNHILPTSLDAERDDFILKRFRMFFEHYYFVELKETGQDDSSLTRPDEERDKDSTKRVTPDSQRHDDELVIQYLIHQDPVGSKRVYAIDLLKGISYMLTHEVKIKGDLSPAEFQTIRNTLTILRKYLPLERWDSSIFKFVEDLRTRLDSERSRYERDGLKAQEMRDLLELSGADDVKLRYGKENWISCYESDKSHKGYTCSLWSLFHTLTVGEYTKAAPVRSKPTLVLYTMRDYITKFLGCSVCSSNFEMETKSLGTSLNYRNSSVLWLWNTHNLVNQRLNNERQEADKKPLAEVIYPSPARCPQCFKSQLLEIGVDGKSYSDIRWEMENVLEFMVDLYKPEKIVSPVELGSLVSKVKSKLNYDLVDMNLIGSKLPLHSSDMNRSVEQWNIQSIFSAGDMSICLFLYLSCIVIVAIVCVALNPKWRRFKTR